ncbi:MAG: hypothetical protein KME06_09385 [Kastovskya adunca ATA6-11-RM4]|jgi:hypothetical protein|nr:hypothetical protein [Kastovskya adunca ATA6-11-RM4]
MPDTGGYFQAGIQEKELVFWGSGTFRLLLCESALWTPETATLQQVLDSEFIEQFGYSRKLLNPGTGTWSSTNRREERLDSQSQSAIGGGLLVDGLAILKNASAKANLPLIVDSGSNTFTTPVAHGLAANELILITSNIALPGGVIENQIYYASNPSGPTFQIAATPGGAAIDLTDNGSGNIYLRYASGKLIAWAKFDPPKQIADGASGQFLLNFAGLNSGYVAGI